ncbi:hypothetical protein TCAL_16577 [Tigriopus californicus]|uniref:Uncharacterized protein n=1 Tax=Tigriopus californicus TaxID=6832 RepID=A0A553NBF8_TIGCA|nr:uncharacterized protein LOC131887796 [Tigriopus californicus]TRY62770.1 hypothetical protein TCAL_16577 [Tigriopus californicus]
MKIIVQTALLSLGALVVLGSPVAQQQAGEPSYDYSNTNQDYYNNDEAAFGQRDEQYPEDDVQVQEVPVDEQQQLDSIYQNEDQYQNEAQGEGQNEQEDALYYPSDAPECCSHVTIQGTNNQDVFYQYLMGDYFPYTGEDFDSYHSVDGQTYPVYMHVLTEDRSELDLEPRQSYLYFYKNSNPDIEETECPEGCWMIGMHDPTPGNYWYGKKYWYVNGFKDNCPEKMTQEDRKLIDQDAKEDTVAVECAAK